MNGWRLVALVTVSVSGLAIAPIPGGMFDRANALEFNSPSTSLGGETASQRSEADRLMRLASERQSVGASEEALGLWQEALDLYSRLADFAGMGRAYDYLGLTFADLGRYAEAEDALRRRLAIARDEQDFQGQVYGLNNLGTVLLHRLNPQSAQALFSEALTIARQMNHSSGQGLSLSNLGLVAASLGRYDDAIEYYEEAVQLRRRAGDRSGEVNTLNNLATVYLNANLPIDALRVSLTALDFARYHGDRPNQVRAIDNLVAVYTLRGQDQQALELLEQRVQLTDRRDRQQQLISVRSLAEAYRRTGNMTAAQETYQQAIAIAQELQNHRAETELRARLGSLVLTTAR
ncbi:tetratricopeptide repeat protein [Oculatella sp. LEGE 06141]|uniref:tetratricopeptide repeat protein n=1 Tax=Oculatella sp. LEGE 06141 TaxID=1828648 RepID=UPI001882A6A1|nr:tetratricopeptide repeat protein [Oculatella sp. LEGE 06141]MBE9177673.1 tetratricopeptide repeat protein [Oculatella sp. LEGE 06141]